MAGAGGGDRAHAVAPAARPRARGQRVPFFAARWEAAGFDPSCLESLDDLWRAPVYTVDDIRTSIEAHPPWGDYQAFTPADAVHEPLRVFMSGGTTGKSRPTFYTQWDREVGGVLTALHSPCRASGPETSS